MYAHTSTTLHVDDLVGAGKAWITCNIIPITSMRFMHGFASLRIEHSEIGSFRVWPSNLGRRVRMRLCYPYAGSGPTTSRDRCRSDGGLHGHLRFAVCRLTRSRLPEAPIHRICATRMDNNVNRASTAPWSARLPSVPPIWATFDRARIWSLKHDCHHGRGRKEWTPRGGRDGSFRLRRSRA